MPANLTPDVQAWKVPHGLFWGGMALAPLAVLVLLFGQSTGALRIAVALAVVAIVLPRSVDRHAAERGLLRVDIEHRVLDEVERVRVKAREDTTTAARNIHRALSDKIHVLTETIEELRAQVDEVQASGLMICRPQRASDRGCSRRPKAHGPADRDRSRDPAYDDGQRRRSRPAPSTAAAPPWMANGATPRRPGRPAVGRTGWDGMAQGNRWAEMRADELRSRNAAGRATVVTHSANAVRSTGSRIDRAALRTRRPDDRSWSGRRSRGHSPASRGEPPSRYVDDGEPSRAREPGARARP